MRFLLNKTDEKKLLALFNQHENNIDYLLYLRRELNGSLFIN